MTLQLLHSEFPYIYEENLFFLFISVASSPHPLHPASFLPQVSRTVREGEGGLPFISGGKTSSCHRKQSVILSLSSLLCRRKALFYWTSSSESLLFSRFLFLKAFLYSRRKKSFVAFSLFFFFADLFFFLLSIIHAEQTFTKKLFRILANFACEVHGIITIFTLFFYGDKRWNAIEKVLCIPNSSRSAQMLYKYLYGSYFNWKIYNFRCIDVTWFTKCFPVYFSVYYSFKNICPSPQERSGW